jgi:hypothetical protein
LWRQAQREIAPGSSVSELVRVLETRSGVEISSSVPEGPVPDSPVPDRP